MVDTRIFSAVLGVSGGYARVPPVCDFKEFRDLLYAPVRARTAGNTASGTASHGRDRCGSNGGYKGGRSRRNRQTSRANRARRTRPALSVPIVATSPMPREVANGGARPSSLPTPRGPPGSPQSPPGLRPWRGLTRASGYRMNIVYAEAGDFRHPSRRQPPVAPRAQPRGPASERQRNARPAYRRRTRRNPSPRCAPSIREGDDSHRERRSVTGARRCAGPRAVPDRPRAPHRARAEAKDGAWLKRPSPTRIPCCFTLPRVADSDDAPPRCSRRRNVGPRSSTSPSRCCGSARCSRRRIGSTCSGRSANSAPTSSAVRRINRST